MPIFTLRSTALMLLLDLFFNLVVIYLLGSLLHLFPEHNAAYWRLAGWLYLIKCGIWLGLRIPLMLPIDRWKAAGSPPEDSDPRLIRAIYYFPFDFTLFYGVLVGGFYAVLVLCLVYLPGPYRLGPNEVLPGMMLAGAVCGGAIAIGVPVNLILTAGLSQRLAERRAATFDQIPGKVLSLKAKMATIALALGCAPSLLLFSVQNFVSESQLYAEAERTALAITQRLAGDAPTLLGRWSLGERVYPFALQGTQVLFADPQPPPKVAQDARELLAQSRPLLTDRRLQLVVCQQNGRGVAVAVANPNRDWLALTMVFLLASLWPLLTAGLLVRTITKPIGLISQSFHRIIGRKRTEESDRVPIFYKDEVGLLAHNANRTIDILTESRAQLESFAQSLAEKNRELEQAYRTKGEFLANMSHELRTPLNAILGFSRLMKRKLGGTLPERQQKNLDLIEQSGEQLLALVNDLLDFERIEAGKLTVHRADFDLEPMLESLATTLTPMAEEKGLKLVFASHDLPQRLHSDKDRLRQILVNLLTNAIRYSDSGTVSLTASGQDGRLRFEVSDQGLGMSPEQLERIFEPFHQVDASYTRERGGAGLGLAIVSRLVRLLKGEIEVVSAPGQGSTFTVTFPLALQALKPTGSGPEILVVDDNLDYLEALHHQLSEAGYRVRAARSGTEALQSLATQRPRLVLLDIVMPEMDGWEVLRRLRSDANLADVPVVITSVVERPEGLELEFSGWLTKPFQLEEFKRFLQTEADLEKGLVIVEDDEHTAQLMVQVFEEIGLKAETFASVPAARQRLSLGLPSVLILDLQLPDGNGWSLLTYLRSLPGHESTRVFIYTATDLTDEQHQQLETHFVSVVPKHGQDSLQELVSSIVT